MQGTPAPARRLTGAEQRAVSLITSRISGPVLATASIVLTGCGEIVETDVWNTSCQSFQSPPLSIGDLLLCGGSVILPIIVLRSRKARGICNVLQFLLTASAGIYLWFSLGMPSDGECYTGGHADPAGEVVLAVLLVGAAVTCAEILVLALDWSIWLIRAVRKANVAQGSLAR